MQRLLDGDLSHLPRLRSPLPRSVPARPDVVPSLLADPPGRALMTYHPPEGFGDAPGWAGETVLFYGADRTWRRLRLDALGLPESAWPGQDTFGPGALSPDGRWWAARSTSGAVLLNLRTGRHRLVDTGTRWVSEVRWRADSSGYVVTNGHPGRTQLVTVPGLEVTELPYRLSRVGIDPDGAVLSLRRQRVGVAALVEHVGDGVVVRGRLTIPGLGRGRARSWGVSATRGRFVIGHQRRPSSFRRVDLTVVDAETVRVTDVLRFDNRDYLVRAWSWLDTDTVLLEVTDGLLAWRPDDATLVRVVNVPPADPNHYWTVDVAADLGRGWSVGG